MSPLTRLIAALTLLLGLSLIAPPARAQGPNDTIAQEADAGQEGESKGDPLYGYIGTAILASVVLFAVCKSARR